MTPLDKMNNAVHAAFESLVDSIPTEVWETLPEYVQNEVNEAHVAIADYKSDLAQLFRKYAR